VKPRLPSIGTIPCSECDREVDEFTAIKEQWRYWSDGRGELLPFCAECARREFAPEAPSDEAQLSRS
jgi:hypothetical protein